MTEYPKIPSDQRVEIYNRYISNKLNKAAEFDEFVEGDFLDPNAKDRLSGVMLRALELCEEHEKAKTLRSGKFDNALGKLLHEEGKIDSAWANDAGFWTWLTFAFQRSGSYVVESRFGKSDTSKNTPQKHFGCERLRGGLLAKTWLAADISFRFQGNYKILDLIDVDFWDSHIIGVDYGAANELVHALIDVVKEKKIIRGDTNDKKVKTGYRDLAKEITRRNPTVCYELMNYNELKHYIEQLWAAQTSWDQKA